MAMEVRESGRRVLTALLDVRRLQIDGVIARLSRRSDGWTSW
jgi:hypothetical protein